MRSIKNFQTSAKPSFLIKKAFLGQFHYRPIVIFLLMLGTSLGYSQRQPNIIYIMTDDMGYGDLGSFGRTGYTTPNLDKLSAQGMKFVNAYSAASLCTPTRAAFMTGRYPARTPVG